jgi:hypothetical protein
MKQAVAERDAEIEKLRDEMKAITGSEEELKKYKEQKEAEERKLLISKLPADIGVNVDDKTNDELQELVTLVEKLKPAIPPAEGDPLKVPDAKRGEGGKDDQKTEDDAVREYNESVKSRFSALKKTK